MGGDDGRKTSLGATFGRRTDKRLVKQVNMQSILFLGFIIVI